MTRTAIITGAGGSIGRAIALRLAEDNDRLALIDVNEVGLKETEQMLYTRPGKEVLSVMANLAKAEEVQKACSKIRKHFGDSSVFVHTAGVAWGTALEKTSIDEWDTVFAINLRAGFQIVQDVIPAMCTEQYGRIVLISSMAGVMGSENAGAHYCSSKAALIGFAKYLSKSYARFGITANCVAPGPVDTDMVKGLGEEVYERLIDSMPTRRLGRPEEIAAVVGLLASEQGGFVTGTVIEASGGQIIV